MKCRFFGIKRIKNWNPKLFSAAKVLKNPSCTIMVFYKELPLTVKKTDTSRMLQQHCIDGVPGDKR